MVRALASAWTEALPIGNGRLGAMVFGNPASDRLQSVNVTLVEPQTVYTACPMSNAVLAGMRGIEKQRFGYDALRQHGIAVVHAAVAGIEADRREAVLVDGTRIAFDRLVFAPGIDLRSTPSRATTRRRPRSCRTPGRLERKPSFCGVSWRRCRTEARSSCPCPPTPIAALQDPTSEPA